MPNIVDVTKATTNHFLDNWAETPFCLRDTEGFDLSGQTAENLFDTDLDFIEIELTTEGRRSAGISQASGVRVLGYLDVQMYTCTGQGSIRLAELESQLYALVERKRIGGAEFRPAAGVTKPYEFRGRATKTVSFPFEYFET